MSKSEEKRLKIQKKKRGMKIVVSGYTGTWTYDLVFPNGDLISVGKWYTERNKALRGAKRLVDAMNSGVIEYVGLGK